MEDIQIYFSEYIKERTGMSFQDSRMLMTDVLDTFINNVPGYNKYLQDENEVLKEKNAKMLEFINDMFNSVQDLKDEVG